MKGHGRSDKGQIRGNEERLKQKKIKKKQDAFHRKEGKKVRMS